MYSSHPFFLTEPVSYMECYTALYTVADLREEPVGINPLILYEQKMSQKEEKALGQSSPPPPPSSPLRSKSGSAADIIKLWLTQSKWLQLTFPDCEALFSN